MKTLKYIFIIMLALHFSACEEFLSEDAPDFNSPELAYRTENDMFLALVGAYDRLGSGSIQYYKRRFLYMVNFASDEMDPIGLGGDRPLHEFTYTSGDNNVNATYRHIYEAIAAANAVIDNLPIADISATAASQFEGEARFLRALHHFNLMRLFGDIVIRDKSVTSPAEAISPRSPESEVYQFIINDLIFAKDNMAATNETGRATSGAAASLLAKVYLTRAGSPSAQPGDYQACVDACNEVITSGVYALTADFEKAIGKEDAFNSESIFEFITTRGGTTGNGELSIWGVFHLPNTTWDIQLNGINADFSGEAATPGTGGIVAEQQFFDMFDPQDYRRDMTFVYSGIDEFGNPIDYTQFPRGLPSMPQKFVDASANTSRSGYAFSANIMILRYADVILMKAEALNELDDKAGAVAELNKIRKRARDGDGGGPWVETGFPADATTGLSKDELRDAILNERAIELAGEGHRWFDLKRTGRLISTLQAQGKPVIAGKHELFPIPQNQLAIKGSLLTQNPSW